MIKTIRRMIRLLRLSWRELLLFEVLYRMITGVIVLSLFSRGISLAIKCSGYSYLTAKNIGLFLLRPVTILVLAVILLTGLLLLALETACLAAALQASERLERLPVHRILIRGLKKFRYYLKKKNFYLIGLNALFLLIAHYVLLLKGMSHMKPLSDLVKTIGESRAGSGLVVLLAVTAVFLLLPGLYALPFALLNKREGKGAWHESRQLMSAHMLRPVFSMLLLNVCLYALYRLVLLALTVVSAWLIYHFVSKTIMLALLLTAYDWLELGVLAGGSIFSTIGNLALLMGLYYTARDEAGMAPELLISEEEEQRSRQKTRRTKTLLTAAAVLFFAIFVYDVVENGVQFARDALVETEITAHRGSSVEAPENTLPAAELAIEQMADYVEIDVQQTADGEIILLHDKSFKRTCGVNKNPWNMTLEEVRRLDAAAYMENYEHVPVPTLEEILECCRGRINLNIELKNNGHDPELPDKVVELVREYGMEKQCVFTSTSLAFLKRVKELDEELKTGYILSTAYGEFYKNDAVDFFSVNSALLNERNMTLIHEYGREIHAWTVNSKTEMERLKHLGVDNIITDYPVLTREILYREKDTENFLEILSMVLR